MLQFCTLSRFIIIIVVVEVVVMLFPALFIIDGRGIPSVASLQGHSTAYKASGSGWCGIWIPWFCVYSYTFAKSRSPGLIECFVGYHVGELSTKSLDISIGLGHDSGVFPVLISYKANLYSFKGVRLVSYLSPRGYLASRNGAVLGT